MRFPNETAAQMMAVIQNGGECVSIREVTGNYPTSREISIDYPARVVAERYHLPLSRAKLVCSLAGIGGKGDMR